VMPQIPAERTRERLFIGSLLLIGTDVHLPPPLGREVPPGRENRCIGL
jgi:hypothetical protein